MQLKHKIAKVRQGGQEVDIKAEHMEATILALQEYMSQRTHPQGKTDGNVTVKPNKKKKKRQQEPIILAS